MPPTLGQGKICYVEIPAADVDVSSDFYAKTFGWALRRRGDGAIAFDDGVGQVSGTWVTGRPAATTGLMVYIMVDDIAASSQAVVANGGEIVQPADPGAPVIFATFRDPAGNVLGMYQEPS